MVPIFLHFDVRGWWHGINQLGRTRVGIHANVIAIRPLVHTAARVSECYDFAAARKVGRHDGVAVDREDGASVSRVTDVH